MLQHLFRGGSDLIGLSADERAGAWSVLVGIAANTSLAQTRPVVLDELAAGIERPPQATDPFGPPVPWQTFDRTRYPFLTGAQPAEVAL